MIDRLLSRFGYWRWPTKNGHRDTDAIARGNRWMAFYNEPGGVAEVLETMRRSYFEKAAHVKPGDVQTLLALSLADRICAEIDGTVCAIITDGKVAADARESADRIAKLPAAMRRRL